MGAAERSFVVVGPSSMIGVGVESYNGEQRLDVRLFWHKGGKWLATKKGIFMPVEQLDEFVRAVLEVQSNYHSRVVEEEAK